MKKTFLRLVVLCLVFAILPPVTASAAVVEPVAPMASDYLDVYNSYCCAMGNGRIEVWFDVLGDDYMDEIGALAIYLYESTNGTDWYHVKTFFYEDETDMLDYNDYVHVSYVSYQGVAGRFYKANTCIWAGKDGDGDARYMWTAVEKAT